METKLTPKICVSIPVTSVAEAAVLAAEASRRGADYIEYRLDYLENLENRVRGFDGLKSLLKASKKPKIATLRSRGEGGLSNLDEDARFKVLRAAADLGFDLVDVELSMDGVEEKVSTLKEKGAKVIVSKHFLNETPSRSVLRETMRAEVEAKADICKIIPKAERREDNLKVLNFLASTTEAMVEDVKMVCFAMGPLGKPSRILAPYFGSLFTYASVGRGLQTAPGQIPIEELLHVYEVMFSEAEA